MPKSSPFIGREVLSLESSVLFIADPCLHRKSRVRKLRMKTTRQCFERLEASFQILLFDEDPFVLSGNVPWVVTPKSPFDYRAKTAGLLEIRPHICTYALESPVPLSQSLIMRGSKTGVSMLNDAFDYDILVDSDGWPSLGEVDALE